MFERSLRLLGTMFAVSAAAASMPASAEVIARKDEPLPDYNKPTAKAPPIQLRRHGKGNKASSCALRACVLGVQHHAGKEFISYAEHDKRVRDTMFAAFARRARSLIQATL